MEVAVVGRFARPLASKCCPQFRVTPTLATFHSSSALLRQHPLNKQDFKVLPSSKCVQNVSYASWFSVVSTLPPVLALQDAMIYLDSVLPYPWWTTIVITTVGIRFLITFPFLIYQNVITARHTNLQPEIKKMAEELKKEVAVAMKLYEWDEKQARFVFKKSFHNHVQRLIERDNCHPLKRTLVLCVQIPLWVSISFAIRNMTSMLPHNDLAAQLTYLSLSNGGLLWIPNLTIPDVSLIFPVLFGVINLTIAEIHALRTFKSTRFQRIVTNLARAMSILMVPIAASVPSCLVLYWTTSSVIGLIQNLILMSPRFRKFVRIPQVVGETVTPYQDLRTNLKMKLHWK